MYLLVSTGYECVVPYSRLVMRQAIMHETISVLHFSPETVSLKVLWITPKAP